MIEYTKSLAKWAAELKYEDIPADVIKKVKENMLDMLGCAVAGSDKPEIMNMKKAVYTEEGKALAWGDGKRIPACNAFLLNGAMSHTVELDDLHKPSKIHAACVIVPPVLTAAEMLGSSGKDILKAIVIGYEIVLRMGMALGTSSHRRRGWHATATCGSFGAAAAVSALMGLDAIQTANALGLAGTQTGGLMAYTADGSMSKRLHAGRAGENGWTSALLASEGFTGPTYVLEAADGGYAHAASDDYNLDILLDGLGTKYHTLDTGLKFYACCGHIHQAIDAAISLVKEYSLTPDMIKSVKVSTYDVAGMAWGFSKAPSNTVEAQFNIPYAVAAAITDKQAFLPQFSQSRLTDSGINALASKITVVTDDKYTKRYPDEWCSGVEITLKNGEVYSKEVCGAKGDPCNPLSDEELKSKFRVLTEEKLPKEKQDKFMEYILGLENEKDLSGFRELMIF